MFYINGESFLVLFVVLFCLGWVFFVCNWKDTKVACQTPDLLLIPELLKLTGSLPSFLPSIRNF